MGMGMLCCCSVPTAPTRVIWTWPTAQIPFGSLVDISIPTFLEKHETQQQIAIIPDRSHWVTAIGIGKREIPSGCVTDSGADNYLLVYLADGTDAGGRPTLTFRRPSISVTDSPFGTGFEVTATFIDTAGLVTRPTNGVRNIALQIFLPPIDIDATIANDPDIVANGAAAQPPGLILTKIEFVGPGGIITIELPETEIVQILAFMDGTGGKELGSYQITSNLANCDSATLLRTFLEKGFDPPFVEIELQVMAASVLQFGSPIIPGYDLTTSGFTPLDVCRDDIWSVKDFNSNVFALPISTAAPILFSIPAPPEFVPRLTSLIQSLGIDGHSFEYENTSSQVLIGRFSAKHSQVLAYTDLISPSFMRVILDYISPESPFGAHDARINFALNTTGWNKVVNLSNPIYEQSDFDVVSFQSDIATINGISRRPECTLLLGGLGQIDPLEILPP